ncbi:immunoglobulin-like domain-containing protein [Thermococcus sp.]
MRWFLVVILVALVIPAAYYLNEAQKEPPKAPVVLQVSPLVVKSMDTIVIKVINNANVNATVGYEFALYRYESGNWTKVNTGLMFIQSLRTIPPGKAWQQTVRLSELKLKPGRYRVEKVVFVNGTKYTVSGEFQVVES